jgi:hypothetical protein
MSVSTTTPSSAFFKERIIPTEENMKESSLCFQRGGKLLLISAITYVAHAILSDTFPPPLPMIFGQAGLCAGVFFNHFLRKVEKQAQDIVWNHRSTVCKCISLTGLLALSLMNPPYVYLPLAFLGGCEMSLGYLIRYPFSEDIGKKS